MYNKMIVTMEQAGTKPPKDRNQQANIDIPGF